MEQLKKLPEGTQLTVGSHKVTILKYLSAGGFAHIYKVHIDPKQDNNDIACLKRVIVPDKSGLDQLRKEVDVMKKLRHCTNVVRYFDSHAERLESGAYQVLVLMELCPNGSLLDYMNAKIKTKLSEPEILKIMFDISKGVFEMHSNRMIHRDLKIENVLIDPNHTFKVGDFGSTTSPIPPPKTQQEFQVLSHDIMYQTTPQYRSPEMIDLYRGFAIDEKADIWALGCFLYKLCYYTTPFEANGDIAILHASFQFPAAPVYSGDLKNLIIIMLQENPFFRPNIVQVIKLVCKMINVDFKTTGIEDIYKAGSYNFQALHHYQQQKQQEMLQQQAYYQQQQSRRSQSPSVPPVAAAGQPPQPPHAFQAPQTPHHPPQAPVAAQEPQAPALNSIKTRTPSTKSAKSVSSRVPSEPHGIDDLEDHNPETKDVMVDVNVEDSSSGDDASLGDLGDLENVEERYPSLDNIIPDELNSDKTDSKKDVKVAAPNVDAVKTSTKISPSVTSTQPAEFSGSNHAPRTSTQYPTQPRVLDPKELRQLTPEQLQQYNYQHQLYHYQMNQWLYYQQHPPQQYPQQQYPHTQPQPPQPPTSQYTQSTRSTSGNVTQLETKEAWEVSETKMDQQAERLADDIFGSKSRSPPGDGTQAPQKTSQSVKSVKSESAIAQTMVDTEPGVDSGDEFDFGTEKTNQRLTKSSNSSEVNLSKPQVHTHAHNSGGRDQADNESTIPQPLQLLTEEGNGHEKDVKEGKVVPEPVAQPLTAQAEPEAVKEATTPYTTSPAINAAPVFSSKFTNPFPLSNEKPEYPEQLNSKPVEAATKKSSNPWGEYRTPAPQLSGVAQDQQQQQRQQLHQQMGSLSLGDEKEQASSRKPSAEEPNLIDLEVGLESSESSTSVAMKPSSSAASNSLHSLIDIDFEEKQKQQDRPHFKKRSSAIPNPADFRVQEEVIDWASDDENPENNSKMNRLSIRSSLKKQSRKSSEHKRSDSASNDNRKRLSRLISNS